MNEVNKKRKHKFNIAKWRSPIQIILTCICFLLASTNTYSKESSQEEITVMAGGFSTAMREYQKQIITQILRYSEEKYGPLDIKYYERDLSPNRGYKETSEGRIVHLGFSTEGNENYQEGFNFSSIKLPIYHDIQGLRKLVVRSEEQDKFAKLDSKKQFLSLRVGQGAHWPDIKMFENSGIVVKEAVKFPNLFSMLDQFRFDYISLGVVEIDKALEQENAIYKNLSVSNNTFIFYPLPISLNFTNHKKHLKERILYGKDRLIDSGDLDRLFNEHFGHVVKKIPRHDAKIFVLRNPNLSDKENQAAINSAISYYFSDKSKVYNLTKLDIE